MVIQVRVSVLACLSCVCTCVRSAIPVWTAGYWADGRTNVCKNAWGWTLGLVGACTEATCLHLHLSIRSSSFMWPRYPVSFSWRWSRPAPGARPKRVAGGPWWVAGWRRQPGGGSPTPRFDPGRRPGHCRRTSCRCCWGCRQASDHDLPPPAAGYQDRQQTPDLDPGLDPVFDPGPLHFHLPRQWSWECCGHGLVRPVQTWCWCWGLCWLSVRRSEVCVPPAWRQAERDRKMEGELPTSLPSSPVLSLNIKWKQNFIRQQFAGMKQRFQPILPQKTVAVKWCTIICSHTQTG